MTKRSGDDAVSVLYVGSDPSAVGESASALAGADGRLDVGTAASASVGLERVAADMSDAAGVDCVVSEYDLGDGTGVELLRAIRERWPELPFVIFAESGDEAAASSAISAGVTDYVRAEPADRFGRLATAVVGAVAEGRPDAASGGKESPAATTEDDGDEDDGAGTADDDEDGDEDEDEYEGGGDPLGGRNGPAEGHAPVAPDDLFYVFDPDGRLREWNGRVETVTGYGPEELDGMEVRELVAADDRERIASAFETALRDGCDRVVVDLSTEGGERVRREVRGSRMTDAGGEVTGVVGVARDPGGRRSRRRRLRRTAARLEALFQHSPDMIDVHDTEGRIVDFNRRFREELGYDGETLLGMTVWEIDQSMDPAEAREIWTEMDVGDLTRVEGRYRRADGSTFPVEVHVGRLDLAGEERFLAMSRDITERVRRERELERQNERLDRFAGVVSHDLRNPLNVARGRTELARMEGESPEEHLAAVERAHDRMETMIDDLLALARGGSDAAEVTSVALPDAVREAWEEADTADAELEVATERVVRADRKQLRRLLANLLGNAVTHGGPDVAVKVGDLPDGFYVEDNGPGIPPAERDRVFDRDYSTADDGHGLGLAIVDRVCESHGWSTAVVEGTDGGARFEVTGDGLGVGED